MSKVATHIPAPILCRVGLCLWIEPAPQAGACPFGDHLVPRPDTAVGRRYVSEPAGRCDVLAFQYARLPLRPQAILFRDALSQGVPQSAQPGSLALKRPTASCSFRRPTPWAPALV
jgi:hypothetical protein